MPLKIFTEHPASVGESYTEHMVFAGGFGLRMILAGTACLIHGVLPFLFERTGSTQVSVLYERITTHRSDRSISEALEHSRQVI